MTSAQETLDRFSPSTAWKPYFPTAGKPWNATRIAHLYRRASFGATHEQISQGKSKTVTELVDQLLVGNSGQTAFEAEVDRLKKGVLQSGDAEQLQSLWMYRLLNSPHPLQERMTLFWHDHFATSNAKVNSSRMMQDQLAILRRHSLGNFSNMLDEIARDPAMLRWLDSNTNKKGKPNENFAREIFELFSLGEGNYTETDIQEAARALTGWKVQNEKAVFNYGQFDTGEKTVLGQTGNWGAGDVVRIALRQDACSKFLVRKLFEELISDTAVPSEELIEPLATEYRIRNYDTTWLVGTMLKSWVFYSDAAIGQKVKSPVDFVVGLARSLEGRVGPTEMVGVCDQLGQSLYYPPSVKGWDGGSDWLNSTTLLHRQNLVFDLTKGSGSGRRTDPSRLVRKYNISGDKELVRFFLDLVHQNPDHSSLAELTKYVAEQRSKLGAVSSSRQVLEKQLIRNLAHLVFTLPEYQLA